MAFGAGTISSAGGAVNDLFSSRATAAGLRLKATGDDAEAGNYDLAAQLARQNEEFTKQETAVKETMTQRQIYSAIGSEEAGFAAGGGAESGSAIDILRSSAQQGALQKQLIGQQGLITEAGQEEQAQAYTNLAGYARYAAGVEQDQAGKAITAGKWSAAFKGASAVASLFPGSLPDTGFNLTQLAAPELIGSGEHVGPRGYSPYAD